jgi:o-succinylbenzoate---CoA ligase
MSRHPRLVRLTDDPASLPAALARVWAAGDAAMVLPSAAPDLPPELSSDPPVDLPPGTALVVPTSGSSGTPRRVVLSHQALATSTAASLARLRCRQGERWALALPLRHVAGLQVLARARALGTAPVLVTDPGDPRAIAAAAADAEHIALVPTQLVRCLDAEADLAGFRTVLVGGGPLSPSHAATAVARGIRLVRSYGMTELCGGVVYDGVPLDGVEMRVDPAGRIALRGAMRADGYLTLDGLDDGDGRFSTDGWFTTDDAGSIDDGLLHVHGRVDEVIVTGGVKVAPVAVETALRTHPQVRDVVVVGVPDPEWGERVRAVVVPADPASPPELAALRAHVAATLPSSHGPRELVVVAGLARDGLGKLRADERARLAEG